jgi:phosphate transport system substrate-binding protein
VSGDRTGGIACLAAALALAACGRGAGPAPAEATLHVAVDSESEPLLADARQAYLEAAPQVTFEVARGDAETVMGLIEAGEADFGLVGEPPGGDFFAAPLALTGLAVITHPGVPVNAATGGDLRAIFGGQVINWADLDGPDQLIEPVIREQGSSAREAFQTAALAGGPYTLAARQATSDAGMVEIVASTPGAIGYAALPYVDGRMRLLSVDGVEPTLEAIEAARYPFSMRIFFVSDGEPDGQVRAFLDWLLGPDGQKATRHRHVGLGS